MSAGELAPRLGRTSAAIKSALLDQKLVADWGTFTPTNLCCSADPPTDARQSTVTVSGQTAFAAVKDVLRSRHQPSWQYFSDYRDAENARGSYQKAPPCVRS